MVGDDEIPGRRSIEKAIEERVAMTIKGLVAHGKSGSEIKVVAKDVVDDDDDSVSVRSSGQNETTQVKDNQMQIGPVGGVEIDVRDCVGESADSVDDGNRIQILPRTRKSRALREQMALEDNGGDVSDQISTTAVDTNHARNSTSGISDNHSTKEATPTTEIRNSEEQEYEQEAYLLDRLSWLQPSFRTLLEPSGSGSSSPGSSSGNKTEIKEVGKLKWNKKVEKVVAKVKNSCSKKKEAQSSHGNVLLETDVKGILKMEWKEGKKNRQVKHRTRFPKFCSCFCGGCCCSCSANNNSERTDEDWEFQLREYSSLW